MKKALLNCCLSRDGSSSGQQTTSFSASLPQICSSLDRDVRPLEILLEPKTQLHSSCNEKDENYLVCGSALQRLFRYFIDGKGRCKCWENIDLSTLNLKRVTPNNHCVKAIWKCKANSSKHTFEWFSSSVVGGKYYVNMRYDTVCRMLNEIL